MLRFDLVADQIVLILGEMILMSLNVWRTRPKHDKSVNLIIER